MGYLISAGIGLLICVSSWIFAGYFWKGVDHVKMRLR